MPRGRAPTLICATCARRSKSITSSVSPSSALTYTVRPSGLKIACSGFSPFTFTVNASRCSRVSMKVTLFDCSLAAAIQRPSAERPTPSGETPSAIAPAVLRSFRSTRMSRLFGWSLT